MLDDCILEEYLKNAFEYGRGRGGFWIVTSEGITKNEKMVLSFRM